MYHPLVSIIIPVYNGSNYMRIAIDSALAQTYDNLEVIVVNDGSNDEGKTDDIARSYGDRIRYFTKENGGVSTALNMAINNMNGEWFSWLSHDDVYKPDKIKAQIDLMCKNIEADSAFNPQECVIYCGSESINVDGKVILRRKYRPMEKRNTREILTNLPYMHVGGCTLLIPRKAFDTIGLFDDTNRTVQDKDLIYRLYVAKYPFFFVDNYLVQSRRHKEQDGNKLKKSDWQKDIDNLNCGFVHSVEDVLSCKDGSVYYAMMIHFLRANSVPAYRLCKEKAREYMGTFSYCSRVPASILYWNVYGNCRKAVRYLYRKLVAGQHQ